MADPWGTVPSWISAIGSVTALIFAAIAVVVSYRAYKIQLRNEDAARNHSHKRELVARQAQGALVSAWWGVKGERFGIFVRNASTNPIYQVSMTALTPDGQSNAEKFSSRVLPPSDGAAFWPSSIPDAQGIGGETRRVTLSFTDSAGIRWLRNKYGTLTEMPPELQVAADSVGTVMLKRFADDFQFSYGVKMGFDVDPPHYRQRDFVADIRGDTADKAPDAVLCPHDWLGSLVVQRRLEPTLLSVSQLKGFPGWALSALTVEGQLYGLPTTTDTSALIRNPELAPEPPKTMEELLDSGTRLMGTHPGVTLQLAVRVGEFGDPFQIWPLFSSAGGWLFRRSAQGIWDTSAIGIDSPESIAAFEKLRYLGESGIGVLRRELDRARAIQAFTSGETAYLISTSDALLDIKRHRTPVAVSAVPPFASGMPAETFTLVHSAAVTTVGNNLGTAHDLLTDYLTSQTAMRAMSEAVSAPVALLGASSTEPAVDSFRLLCERGVPMPNFAQMDGVWRALEAAQAAAITGAAAEPIAHEAADKIAALFATEKS